MVSVCDTRVYYQLVSAYVAHRRLGTLLDMAGSEFLNQHMSLKAKEVMGTWGEMFSSLSTECLLCAIKVKESKGLAPQKTLSLERRPAHQPMLGVRKKR